MKVTKAINIDRLDYKTVKEIRDMLDKVPDDAIVTIQHQKADYNRMDYYTASIRWTEEM